LKVLLIQPPHIGDRVARPPTFLPSGLGYIASVLRENGFDVSLLDIWGGGLSLNMVTDYIKRNEFDVFGITAFSTQWNYVEQLVGAIRALSSGRIVLGGPLATFSQEEVFSVLDVDVCVMSEGERTIVDYLSVLREDGNLENVKGITWRSQGTVIVNEPQEYIKDLDSLPLPAYDLFDMDSYLANCSVYSKYQKYNDLPALNVFNGRGCPYNCNFCSRTMHGARYRSVDSVIDEIKYLMDRFGIRGVFFNDEMVVSPRRRTFELCEKIAPLGLKWNCQGRSNLVDEELLRAMKNAGCVSIGFGVESGSQRLLDAMNKKQKVEQIIKAINTTVKVGMEPVPQWMFGYPGEDDQTIAETIRTCSRFDFPMNPIFICTPLPGTKLYRDAVRSGKIKDRVKFHQELSDGYSADAKILVNFTQWSDEVFLKKKDELELSVKTGFIKHSLLKPRLYGTLLPEINQILRSKTGRIRRRVRSRFKREVNGTRASQGT